MESERFLIRRLSPFFAGGPIQIGPPIFMPREALLAPGSPVQEHLGPGRVAELKRLGPTTRHRGDKPLLTQVGMEHLIGPIVILEQG